MSNLNKIIIFTDSPAIAFVANEIKAFSRLTEKVFVICKTNDAIKSTFSSNVHIVKLKDFDIHSKKDYLIAFFSNFKLLINILFGEFTSPYSNYHHKIGFIRITKHLLKCCVISKKVSKIPILNENYKDSILLSFWFNDWATILGILKSNNKISNYYSRTHGRDLFEFREPLTEKLLFREFQLKTIQKVFSVSKAGEVYLSLRYPKFKNKIFTSYLGSYDHGISPFSEENEFTIVSCANIRNVKRIHLLIEVLSILSFDFKWIHFGKEPDVKSQNHSDVAYYKAKEKLLQRENCKVVIRGSCSNDEILKFYKLNSVNLFVSVSETEGIPVSMMEATSFGIPILSTDVGGCSEVVTNKSGLLISKNFKAVDVANLITHFKNSDLNKREFHIEVRKFWEQNFNIEHNNKGLISMLC